MSDDTGSVVTVEGGIDPDELGSTLVHEHTFTDFARAWFDEPESAYKRKLAYEPVSLENQWYIDQNHFRHEDNLRLDSFEEAVEEYAAYYRAGGDTVVDVTPKGVGPDPNRVRGVARETGLQFVHGTAYYVRSAHPDRLDDATVEALESEFVSDVREGIDDTDVRAGLIGEIGTSGHLHDVEETVLRAGARAARRTGAPLSIHPPGRTAHSQRNRTYPRSRWALEILDIVEEEGLPPERVAICHMDGTLYEDLEYQFELAERGAYLEYDLWGTEKYLERWNDGYPSDAWRVDAVGELIERGHADRLLFSHDIGSKSKRRAHGGHGYAHVLESVLPRLEANGVDRETLDRIMVENPREWLAFAEPDE